MMRWALVLALELALITGASAQSPEATQFSELAPKVLDSVMNLESSSGGGALFDELGLQGMTPSISNPGLTLITNLPASDFEFPPPADGSLQAVEQPINIQPLTTDIASFCEGIRNARGGVTDSPSPVIVSSFRLFRDDDIASFNACVGGSVINPGAPLVLEIPIALTGVAFLTSNAHQFPAWFAPDHLVVGLLKAMPSNIDPNVEGRWLPESCTASAVQPPRAQLTRALATAACVVSDDLGRRLVGEKVPRSFVSYARTNSDAEGALRDFTPLYYDVRSPSENQLGSWGAVDVGLRDRDIELMVTDLDNASLPLRLCTHRPEIAEALRDSSNSELIKLWTCSWRNDASTFDNDQFFASAIDLTAGNRPILAAPLMWALSRGEGLLPLSFAEEDGRTSTDASRRIELFREDLRNGTYPFAVTVFLYLDPLSLTDRATALFVRELLRPHFDVQRYEGNLLPLAAVAEASMADLLTQ